MASYCVHCLNLGSGQRLKKCSACHVAVYCSKECQRAAWPSHKDECKAARQAKEADRKRADSMPGVVLPPQSAESMPSPQALSGQITVGPEGRPEDGSHVAIRLGHRYTQCGPKWVLVKKKDYLDCLAMRGDDLQSLLIADSDSPETRARVVHSVTKAVLHFWKLRRRGIAPKSEEIGNLGQDTAMLYAFGAEDVSIDPAGFKEADARSESEDGELEIVVTV